MPLFFAGITYTDPGQREWLIERLLQIDRRTGWASAGTIARSVETGWERAAGAGRGPEYRRRRTRRAGEEGPVVLGEEERVDDGEGGVEVRVQEGGGGVGLAGSNGTSNGERGGNDSERRSGAGFAVGGGAPLTSAAPGPPNTLPTPTGYTSSGAQNPHAEAQSANEKYDKRFTMRLGRRPWAMGVLEVEEDLSDSMEKVGLRDRAL